MTKYNQNYLCRLRNELSTIDTKIYKDKLAGSEYNTSVQTKQENNLLIPQRIEFLKSQIEKYVVTLSTTPNY